MLSKVFLPGKKLLIPYFTCGDPSLDFTEDLVYRSIEAGADVIELGLPFSDPIADGPVIQASHQRALLNQDVHLDSIFSMISKIKSKSQIPLTVMGAANLVFHYGIASFFKEARKAGIDGVIIPDLPVEEALPFAKEAKRHHVDLIFLLSPLCSDERIPSIVRKTEGFLYLMSSTGVTGVRQSFSMDLKSFSRRIKTIKDVPLAVGFGISSEDHLRMVYDFAEAAIVGSFFVKMIEKSLPDLEKAKSDVCRQIRSFKKVAQELS